jgi:peptide/nickel transport system ATP-binding protein
MSDVDADSRILLRVNHLSKHFQIREGVLQQRKVGAIRAVEDVSFAVRGGQTLGLVGESGCGKSTLGRLITMLHQPTSGSIVFDGRQLEQLNTRQMRPVRTDLQMIFQDPYSSLNPRHTVGSIIAAPLHIHGVKPPGGVKREVQSLMERVGLNPEHYNRYPNEFSGGQRQRIGIARAIALRPKLIVCDEPVSALDVSVQAQVINLLEDLQSEFGLTYVFITHNLSVVRHICDQIAVMYLGRIVELASRDALYEKPQHPYTRALLSAVPVPTPPRGLREQRLLLHGEMPSPSDPPSGCVFHTRCPKYQTLDADQKSRCETLAPDLVPRGVAGLVACHFPEAGS